MSQICIVIIVTLNSENLKYVLINLQHNVNLFPGWSKNKILNSTVCESGLDLWAGPGVKQTVWSFDLS